MTLATGAPGNSSSIATLRGRVSEIRLSHVVIAATVLAGIWLVFVPLAALLFTAFTEDNLFGVGAPTFDNFINAYASAEIIDLLTNSVIFAVGAAVLTFFMGAAVAWVVERTDAPGSEVFHTLSLLAFALPGLLVTMAWIFVFSPNIGWLNALFKDVFGLSGPVVNIYSMLGMIWVLASHYFPLAYLALGPAFRVLDVRMEEAGLASGARYRQILFRITFPLLRPAILSCLLLLFILGMSSFEVPRLLGRPARIDVFTTEIQNATGGTPPEFGLASALSITLLLICVVAIYFYRRATRNAEAFATITGKGYTPTRIKLRGWRWPVTIAVSLMFVVSLGLPLITLAWQSFFRKLVPPLVMQGQSFTLENYTFVLGYPIFVEAVQTSVTLAAMAATIIVLLTFVMAWIAQRSMKRNGWIIDAIAFTPIAIPSVIVGAAVLFAYLVLPIPVYNTIWILLIAYVTMYMPYGMRFASGGITQIHKELEEVAEVAGARTGQIFFHILLPLLAPFLLAGWIYVFVLAVRELGASIFLVGPGTHVLGTISLTMWEEGGSYGNVCALGMIQILPLLVIVAGLRWLETRLRRRVEVAKERKMERKTERTLVKA